MTVYKFSNSGDNLYNIYVNDDKVASNFLRTCSLGSLNSATIDQTLPHPNEQNDCFIPNFDPKVDKIAFVKISNVHNKLVPGAPHQSIECNDVSNESQAYYKFVGTGITNTIKHEIPGIYKQLEPNIFSKIAHKVADAASSASSTENVVYSSHAHNCVTHTACSFERTYDITGAIDYSTVYIPGLVSDCSDIISS